MSQKDDSKDRMLRREFGRHLLTAAAITSGTAGVNSTSMLLEAAEAPPVPKLPEDQQPTPPEPPLPSPEALLLTYLVRQYPNNNIDKQAIQGIYRDIQGDVARGKILSDFLLTNSDEPAFHFAAYRSSDAIPPKSDV